LTTARAAWGALAAAVLALPGCTDWAGYDLDVAAGKVPQLATMRTDVIPDRYGMVREPAEGTVPVIHPLGDVPAPYTQAQIDSVAPTLSNPLPASPEVIERGRIQYETSCAVCHGVQGDGRGSVIDAQRKFPYAPPVGAGSPTATRSDGYIYAVIDVGRGLMPPYGHRMTHLDRWAVVSYLRQMQGTAGPVPVAGPQVTPLGEAADTATAPGPQPQAGAPAAGDTGSSTEN
jgi:mono/diheme cytochrome c family protein